MAETWNSKKRTKRFEGILWSRYCGINEIYQVSPSALFLVKKVISSPRSLKSKSLRVLYFSCSGNTAKDASFSGSMQLLAGVKLCTDRHITNHPHYENKILRLRTKDVSMYLGFNKDGRWWPRSGMLISEQCKRNW